MLNFFKSDCTQLKKNILAWVFFCILLLMTSVQGYRDLDGLYGDQGVHLSSSIPDWVKAWTPHDMAAYIKVANNIAYGMGMVEFCESPRCQPAQWVPWHFWGPGTPLFFSFPIWISKIFNFFPMMTIFIFGLLCQIVIAIFAVKTVRLYTQNTFAIFLTLFFCAYFPPLQNIFFYGDYIGTSEVAISTFLSAFLFYLQKAYLLLWSQKESRKEVFKNFLYAGLLLGIMHTARESMITFAPFVFVLTVALALLKKVSKQTLKTAFLAGLIFFLSTAAINVAVKSWNKKRVGIYAVGSGTLGIFHDNLWAPWDGKTDAELDQPWYVEAGIGFPSFLDPVEGQRVRYMYEKGGGYSDRQALLDFIKVLLQNPAEAVQFKLKRLPILLFDMNKIPKWSFKTEVNIWMVCLYILTAFYLFLIFKRKKSVPEILYFYFLFILCSFVMIHAEFRYTFPVVFALRLIPALIAAELISNLNRKQHEIS